MSALPLDMAKCDMLPYVRFAVAYRCLHYAVTDDCYKDGHRSATDAEESRTEDQGQLVLLATLGSKNNIDVDQQNV